MCADTPDRILTKDTYGRTILQRVQKQHGIKYLSIRYCSRAMEWLDLRRTFKEVLSHFGILDQIDLDSLAFAWSYDRSIATRVYKPSQVFKHFSFVHLLDKHEKCMCNSFKRFESFLDPLTFVECDEFSHPVHHVRTIDLNIIQHPKLREAIGMGLNHIPLSPTDTSQALKVAIDAFQRMYSMFRLHEFALDMQVATMYFERVCCNRLSHASRSNKFGYKSSGPALFSIPAVADELQWLLSHVYISGLDKASNNPCFMCIRHIRLQALCRLSSEDFTPCISDGT